MTAYKSKKQVVYDRILKANHCIRHSEHGTQQGKKIIESGKELQRMISFSPGFKATGDGL